MKRNRATDAVKYQTPHGQLIPVPVLNALHLHITHRLTSPRCRFRGLRQPSCRFIAASPARTQITSMDSRANSKL
jgi:hypothetical protein